VIVMRRRRYRLPASNCNGGRLCLTVQHHRGIRTVDDVGRRTRIAQHDHSVEVRVELLSGSSTISGP
jgi:hypothetical protein